MDAKNNHILIISGKKKVLSTVLEWNTLISHLEVETLVLEIRNTCPWRVKHLFLESETDVLEEWNSRPKTWNGRWKRMKQDRRKSETMKLPRRNNETPEKKRGKTFQETENLFFENVGNLTASREHRRKPFWRQLSAEESGRSYLRSTCTPMETFISPAAPRVYHQRPSDSFSFSFPSIS